MAVHITNQASLRFVLNYFFSLASPDADVRTQSGSLMGTVKRQGTELRAIVHLPRNAVLCRADGRTNLRTLEDRFMGRNSWLP
jgi:hypothetical protein